MGLAPLFEIQCFVATEASGGTPKRQKEHSTFCSIGQRLLWSDIITERSCTQLLYVFLFWLFSVDRVFALSFVCSHLQDEKKKLTCFFYVEFIKGHKFFYGIGVKLWRHHQNPAQLLTWFWRLSYVVPALWCESLLVCARFMSQALVFIACVLLWCRDGYIYCEWIHMFAVLYVSIT